MAAVVASLAYVYFDKAMTPSRDPFPYSSYIQSPKGLEGNTYTVLASVDAQLAKTDSGRVVSLRDNMGNPKFAVFIPDSLGLNVSANQKYRLNIRVSKGGSLQVESMKKF